MKNTETQKTRKGHEIPVPVTPKLALRFALRTVSVKAIVGVPLTPQKFKASVVVEIPL